MMMTTMYKPSNNNQLQPSIMNTSVISKALAQ